MLFLTSPDGQVSAGLNGEVLMSAIDLSEATHKVLITLLYILHSYH